MRYDKTRYNRLYAGELEDWVLYTDDDKWGLEDLQESDEIS